MSTDSIKNKWQCERPCDTAGGTEAGGSHQSEVDWLFQNKLQNEVGTLFRFDVDHTTVQSLLMYEPTTMLVPVLHKTLSTLVIASALSSNVLLAALPTTSASAAGISEQPTHSAAASPTSSLVLQPPPQQRTPPTLAAIMPLPFRRYATAGDIPKAMYQKNRIIRGRVIKVIDGDTIRIRHTPLYPLAKSGDYSGKLSECTVSVRFYGVDAPETAKFGNPEQPYAREAKEYVASRVDGKMVRVKLLRKDQYSRAVAKVTVRHRVLPFLRTDLTKGLAERGYATLYTGGGAEYDGKREVLEKKIKRAQRRRRGIWSNGVGNHVDPAAYKREIKARNGSKSRGRGGGGGSSGGNRASGKENRKNGANVRASVY